MLNDKQKEKLKTVVWTSVVKVYSAHSLLAPSPDELSPETEISEYYPIEYVGDDASNRFNLVISNIAISLNHYFKTNEKIDFAFREELAKFLTLEDIFDYFYEKLEKNSAVKAKIQ